MDWDQIDQIVTIEKDQNRNPIALLIYSLELQDDRMILRFPRHDTLIGNDPNKSTTVTVDEDDDGAAETTIDVPVMLQETAHANANRLFAKYRAAKEKTQKTIEASSKALKAAEEAAKRQLAESNKRKLGAIHASGPGGAIPTKRIYHWYEKFHWFITSDNDLVIGGRDAQQNELLVKRYLRPGDAYLHADIFGAASCILRAKRRRVVMQPSKGKSADTNPTTKTEIVPLSDIALREAGNFCICHSSAWSSKIITSAWWVEAHQVSKTAPTGEYLTTGAFMIRGKKNYLPPSTLEMGLAVLFRYSDDDPDAVERHKNERRDFALLNNDNGNDIFIIDSPNDDRDTNYNVDGRKHEIAKSNHEKLDEEYESTPENEQNGASTNLPEPTQESDTNTEANNTPVAPASEEFIQHAVISDDDSDNDNDENDGNDDDENNNESETDDSDNDLENDEADHTQKDDIKTESPAVNEKSEEAPKKRGLSARDRKLIKRYGSLEEAHRILGQNNKPNEPNGNETVQKPSNKSKEDKNTTIAEANKPKRGKKAKEKRVMKKYADQDEEDRKLALLALQGGEQQKSTKKKGSANNKKGKGGALTSARQQEELAAEAAKLLIKDSRVVAMNLSQDVRDVLIECITVRTDTSNNADPSGSLSDENIRWDKLDGDTLDQLLSLEPQEARLAAVKRLLVLKQSTRVDNFSSSLGGIIRTIRKYGYETFDKETVVTNEASGKRKSKGAKPTDSIYSKSRPLDPKIGAEEEDEEGAVDDTIEISKLTGKPFPDDLLLYCVPVCGPYASLQQYAYRVKLTPGNMKRGKAAKQCVELFLKIDVKAKVPISASQEKQLDLIKRVPDTDWVQAICADTKISSAGASKVAKAANVKGKYSKK